MSKGYKPDLIQGPEMIHRGDPREPLHDLPLGAHVSQSAELVAEFDDFGRSSAFVA
jgi:hypothetical protein